MNFDNFIDYFNKLETKYDWTYLQWRPVRDLVDDFLKHRNDSRFYLGVAGEFSSGKSTLINALLHKNLLKEDVLQGTTCAPTFISYGSQFDVEIHFVDNHSLRLQEELDPDDDSTSLDFDDPRVRAFINRYTADEKYAATVKHVQIYLRNKILQSGLVIIDTPGINADNARHSEVTQDVIQEYCDAALIIIPASAPCSQTLCNFVRDYLEQMQNRCIGVITQIDRVRPREHARQIAYVAKRLESETQKKLGAIVPVSAWYANETNDDPELDVLYKQMFKDFEKTFQEKMVLGREELLNASLTEILQRSILPQMTKVVNSRRAEVEAKRNALSSEQLANPVEWLSRKKAEYFAQIEESAANWTNEIPNAQNYLFQQTMLALDQATSKESVRWVAQTRFGQLCNETWNGITNQILPYRNLYFEQAQKILEVFKQEFSDAYRNLGVSISVDVNTNFTFHELNSCNALTDQFKNEGDELLRQLDEQFGQEVFEGNKNDFVKNIGTGLRNWGLRGVTDRVANAFGDPTKMRDALREMLSNHIPQWIQQILVPGMEQVMAEGRTQANEAVERLMNIYFESHSTVIYNIINRERRELEELNKKLLHTQADLEELNSFQTQIDSEVSSTTNYPAYE